MLNIVNRRRERALVRIDQALFDVSRGKAGILPDDAHHRDVDGRENIRGRAQQHERRQEQQQQRGHHEGVRAPQG